MSKRTIHEQREKIDVTEHEGMLLALALRLQPMTAYQIYKVFEQSSVTSINTSKGQIYPAIKRLKARGFLKARKLRGDRRNSEELTVTDAGKTAVRVWVKRIDESHVILDDPLRTRLFSFDLLTREERLEWLAKAKSLIQSRQVTVDEFDRSADVPFQEFAYRSVADALRTKIHWLDDLLHHIANSD